MAHTGTKSLTHEQKVKIKVSIYGFLNVNWNIGMFLESYDAIESRFFFDTWDGISSRTRQSNDAQVMST